MDKIDIKELHGEGLKRILREYNTKKSALDRANEEIELTKIKM